MIGESNRKSKLNFKIRDNCLGISYKTIIVENQLIDLTWNITAMNNDNSQNWLPTAELDTNILSGLQGSRAPLYFVRIQKDFAYEWTNKNIGLKCGSSQTYQPHGATVITTDTEN